LVYFLSGAPTHGRAIGGTATTMMTGAFEQHADHHQLVKATAFEGLTLGSATPAKVTTMKDLAFLTRDGCVNTPDMVNNLNDALKALGWPNDYQYIDIGKLRKADARTGYPTPTVLWKGTDIFGMPVLTPPFDVPS
jgi:hypothetical protein